MQRSVYVCAYPSMADATLECCGNTPSQLPACSVVCSWPVQEDADKGIHSILLDTVKCATVVSIPCPLPPCQRLQPAEGWHHHAERFAVHVRMRTASTPLVSTLVVTSQSACTT